MHAYLIRANETQCQNVVHFRFKIVREYVSNKQKQKEEMQKRYTQLQ